MSQPKFTDMKSVNKWWTKAMVKEQARFSNTPASPKSNKWLVPEIMDAYAPQMTKAKGHASR